MLNLPALRKIITDYNRDECAGGLVPIDVGIAERIIQILNTRPPLPSRTGVKIPKNPSLLPPIGPIPLTPCSLVPTRRGNTAYVIKNSDGQRLILIKGNTQVSRGIAEQTDQIGFGTTKMVKLYGGILIELNDQWDVTSDESVKNIITFSSIVESLRIKWSLETHTKFGAMLNIIQNQSSDFIYTFKALKFVDPTTYENRLFLYQVKAGKDFSKVRKSWAENNVRIDLQQRVQAAVSYLDGIKAVLRKSLWPVDLKPENIGYEEIAGVPGTPLTSVLNPLDYLGSGATFTVFKNQYVEMIPLLKGLLTRPVDDGYREALKNLHYAPNILEKLMAEGYTEELFNALIRQLIFELAYVVFLILNPRIQFVYEAQYNKSFGAPEGSDINVKLYGDARGFTVSNSENTRLYNFFKPYCRNKNFREICFPSFRTFLRRLQSAFAALPGVVVPPSLSNDAWIAEFNALVHKFRTSPAPIPTIPTPIDNLVMTL